MYTIPSTLEKRLLSYVKKTYLPKGRVNPKTADQFNAKDLKFFARGIADMSAYFTSERSSLPKNYLNMKELRAGYLLYFVITNYLKVQFCLDESGAKDRFKGDLNILDVGCGPGAASLACADYFRDRHLNVTAIDQNIGALKDAKQLLSDKSHVDLYTLYSNIKPNRVTPLINGERRIKDKKFNIVILENFLSELRELDDRKVIVEALYANHLKDDGIIIIIEPALRWTTRDLMRLRDIILQPTHQRTNLPAGRHGAPTHCLAPCLHTNPCPMLIANKRDWCHMYLDWERPKIIEEIDKLIGNRKEYIKFSYLILERTHQRTNAPTHQWRVVSAPMYSKGKTELLLCNNTGLKKLTRQEKDVSPTNKDFNHITRGSIVDYSGGGSLGKYQEFKIIKTSG